MNDQELQGALTCSSQVGKDLSIDQCNINGVHGVGVKGQLQRLIRVLHAASHATV